MDESGFGPPMALPRAALGALALKTGFILLSFGLSILLARVLGPHGYGSYAYALAWLVLLAQATTLGLPVLLVREVAALQAKGEWGRLIALLGWSQRFAGMLSCAVVLAALGGLLALAERDSPRFAVFAWALALLPLLVFAELRGALLRGLQRVVWSQLPDALVRPLAQGGLLLALLLAAGPAALTPAAAMALYGAALLAALLVSGRLCRDALHFPAGTIPAGPEQRRWLASVFPLGMAGMLQIVNQQNDILLLGWFAPAHEVGLYKVAAQGATVVVFALDALNLVLAPQVSRLHALGERASLQRLLLLGARFSLALALLPGVVLIVSGGDLLAAVFGEEYRRAHPALAILCAGQIVNAAMGAVGLLLNMTGHEHDMLHGLLLTTLCNIALNLLLIPPFGINGAACATAASLLLWNGFMLLRARRRLAVVSLPWIAGGSR